MFQWLSPRTPLRGGQADGQQNRLLLLLLPVA